jgi:hypothetical protein
LKDNGGLLDEVIFAVRTDIEEDLVYLEELLQTSPRYSKHVAKKAYELWVGSWEAVNEPDSIYIKIDDDIVRQTPSILELRICADRELRSIGIYRQQHYPSCGQAQAREPEILRRLCERR